MKLLRQWQEEEMATLEQARQILLAHGHGIGAACLSPCWDLDRRLANLKQTRDLDPA